MGKNDEEKKERKVSTQYEKEVRGKYTYNESKRRKNGKRREMRNNKDE